MTFQWSGISFFSKEASKGNLPEVAYCRKTNKRTTTIKRTRRRRIFFDHFHMDTDFWIKKHHLEMDRLFLFPLSPLIGVALYLWSTFSETWLSLRSISDPFTERILLFEHRFWVFLVFRRFSGFFQTNWERTRYFELKNTRQTDSIRVSVWLWWSVC